MKIFLIASLLALPGIAAAEMVTCKLSALKGARTMTKKINVAKYESISNSPFNFNGGDGFRLRAGISLTKVNGKKNYEIYAVPFIRDNGIELTNSKSYAEAPTLPLRLKVSVVHMSADEIFKDITIECDHP